MTARAELAALVAELAGGRARHPAWRFLVESTAALEAAARLFPRRAAEDVYATYLSANGSPRSDTFMARDRTARDRTLAERVARAILRARAATGAIARLDGQLPEQPLWRALRRRGAWLERAELPPRPAAAFVTPRGVFRATLDEPIALARALAAACAGRPHEPWLERVDDGVDAHVAAPVAVDLAPQPDDSARHLHRRAWSAGGGPWLGVGETRDLELVTTCHLAVDGYGHGRLTTEVFAAMDRVAAAERDALVASAAGVAGDAPLELAPADPVDGALPLGFAGRVVPSEGLRFAHLSYASARTLQIFHERTPGDARLAPTLQVTLAPGDRDDPERRRRRVRFALLTLRGSAAEPEPFDAFAARLRTLIELENQRPGLLMRVLAATANAPLPRAVRRSLLSSEGRPNPRLPPVEVLGGRGSLSFMRFADDERPPAPMYGLSSPGLVATAEDPFGSFVVTVIDHGASCTVSIGGTGVAGDGRRAGEVLETFVEELERAVASSGGQKTGNGQQATGNRQ